MTRMSLAVGVVTRPLAGEVVSGDAHLVLPWTRGILIAAIDGLGHGEKAAAAAGTVMDVLRRDPSEALAAIFLAAHSASKGGRGAVCAVARFDVIAGSFELAGLGNIGVVLARRGPMCTAQPTLVPGVLGSAMRAVRPEVHPFDVGDRLVLHSDGVRSRIDLSSIGGLSAQRAAETLLSTHGKSTDDALCVVVDGVSPRASEVAEPIEGAHATVIGIRLPSDPATAAVAVRRFAAERGFSVRAQWEASIAAAELATNILKFGTAGDIHASFDPELGTLTLDARDAGPGIVNPDDALKDGYSEGAMREPGEARVRGLGVGLGSVRRLMDEVDIGRAPGGGTRVIAKKRR